MCRLRATSRQKGDDCVSTIGGAAPAPPHQTLPPRRVRYGPHQCPHRCTRRGQPDARSAAQESAFSALACGDSGPVSPQPTGVRPGRTTRPVSTTWKNSNRRYRQVSVSHSEQIWSQDMTNRLSENVYQNGSAPMRLANTAVKDAVVIPAPVARRSRNRRARPTLARRNPTVSLVIPVRNEAARSASVSSCTTA